MKWPFRRRVVVDAPIPQAPKTQEQIEEERLEREDRLRFKKYCESRNLEKCIADLAMDLLPKSTDAAEAFKKAKEYYEIKEKRSDDIESAYNHS